MFTTVIAPCGTARDEWKSIMLLHFYKYQKTSLHHHAKGVYMLYTRLMASLHKYTHGWWFNDKMCNKIPKDDFTKTFQEIWRSAVVPTMRDNQERCELMR
jgi:hypothetical protein